VDYARIVKRIGNEMDLTLVNLDDMLPAATVMVRVRGPAPAKHEPLLVALAGVAHLGAKDSVCLVLLPFASKPKKGRALGDVGRQSGGRPVSRHACMGMGNVCLHVLHALICAAHLRSPFAPLLCSVPAQVVTVTGTTTSGKPLSQENLAKALDGCEMAFKLDADKLQVRVCVCDAGFSLDAESCCSRGVCV